MVKRNQERKDTEFEFLPRLMSGERFTVISKGNENATFCNHVMIPTLLSNQGVVLVDASGSFTASMLHHLLHETDEPNAQNPQKLLENLYVIKIWDKRQLIYILEPRNLHRLLLKLNFVPRFLILHDVNLVSRFESIPETGARESIQQGLDFMSELQVVTILSLKSAQDDYCPSWWDQSKEKFRVHFTDDSVHGMLTAKGTKLNEYIRMQGSVNIERIKLY